MWEVALQAFHIPKWLLPAPSEILRELYVEREMIASHALVTLYEILAGFSIAIIVGVGLALSIAYSRLIERSLYPFVIASQTIPIIAIAPLLLIWIGYGISPKIIVVALVAFFPIVVNMVDGLKNLDDDMVSMIRTFGASKWQIFCKIQIPSSIPSLFSGIKIAAAVSVIGAVIGEWVGSSQGLGYLMTRSIPQFETERVFASIFILSLMGIMLFLLVFLAERILLRSYYKSNQSSNS
ncbi:ABC transporter permease [SAR202 cluster bacterium AC-409-J13_OGT_754m]|nr:ABC transporter permease [SAR202 cluster bacterium AC-409-J13_OGT_754m]